MPPTDGGLEWSGRSQQKTDPAKTEREMKQCFMYLERRRDVGVKKPAHLSQRPPATGPASACGCVKGGEAAARRGWRMKRMKKPCL